MTHLGGIWVITRGTMKSRVHRDTGCSQPTHLASRQQKAGVCVPGSGQVGVDTGDPGSRLGPSRRPGAGVGCGRDPLGIRGPAQS